MWVVLALVLFQPPPNVDIIPWPVWQRNTLLFGLLLASYYLNVLVLVPRLLLAGQPGRYLLVSAALVLAISLGHRPTSIRLFGSAEGSRAPAGGLPPPPASGGVRWPLGRGGGRFDTILLLTHVLLLAAGAGRGLARQAQADAQTDAQARQELEQEKTTAELALLKAQINPHFFFNTLHNIYALTLLDGDRARQALHQLSRLMRYVLYDTESSLTRVAPELAFLRDYVDLMHLRLPVTTHLTLDLPEPPLYPDALLAPMLLLPFVENAFKHGVSTEQVGSIRIAVRQPLPRTLVLEVVNTHFTDRNPATAGAALEASNGIGLNNTRRRLQLLYPGQHLLQISDATPAAEYRVLLTLELAG